MRADLRFDWIIGNPPWVELKPEMAEPHVRRWIEQHARQCPIADKRIVDAFSWRVADFLQDNGLVGLLIHANALFNRKSQAYRQTFFKRHFVEQITNLANFRHVLFPGADAPAATCIYRRRRMTEE